MIGVVSVERSSKSGELAYLVAHHLRSRPENVRLRGSVHTEQQKAAVEEIARHFPGVRSVTNTLLDIERKDKTMINQPDPRITEHTQRQETINPEVVDSTTRSATTDGSRGESRHEHYVNLAGNQIESQVEVYQDTNLRRENRRSWVTTLIYFLLSVLEVILALRLVFRLLGANQSNGFTQFLYNLSQVFVAPFHGIFHDQTLGTGKVFEISTLIAMLIAALIAWGLIALSRVVFAPNEGGRQRITTTRSKQH